MKLKIYSIFDKLAGQSVMLLTAANNDIFKRQIRGALMVRDPNPINTDCEDKDVYCVGVIDTETQLIEQKSVPEFAFSIEKVRQDLVAVLSAKTGKEIDDPAEVVDNG